MKFLLFFVLLSITSSTVISGTGFNGRVILQPVSSPGLVLRKVPRTLSPAILMSAEKNWPNLVFLKNIFELECLKQIYNRGRLKNRPGSTRPGSFVPGPEGPAYKIVNKNQGSDYDKIPDPYRPNTGFENGKRYFGGNVRIIPLPVPYRSGYHRYKPDSNQDRNKFIKNSSPHPNHGYNISEIEKGKQEMISNVKTSPHYTTTSRSTTTTTTTSSFGDSVNKPIKFYPAEITDKHILPFNDLIKGSLGIPKQNNEYLPMVASYGDAKTFSKFFRQSNRIKPTTASYPENTSSNNLWYGSKPRPNHSYEVEEIIEEDIRFDLEEKKEGNHMTKKPPGGRQFKFDKSDYEGLKIGVPNTMKPVKNEVIDSSINTILNSLVNPVKRITETEGKTSETSNNPMITPSNSSLLPKRENISKAQETFINLPPLLPQANVESSHSQENKTQNDYMTNKKDVYIPPYPSNDYFNFFRTSTPEKAQDEFSSHQPVPFQNVQNQEPHSTSTGQYDEPPLQPFFLKESQQNINYKDFAEMEQKTENDFPRLFPIVQTNDLYLPEVFKNLAGGFPNPDRIFPTPKGVSSEEQIISSTSSPILYDHPLNLLPTSPKSGSNQSTPPPNPKVLFTPEAYNNLDFQILKSSAEREEERTDQRLFTPAPLLEFTAEDQNTETEPSGKDEETSTQSDSLEIQTEFDLLDSDRSKSKPETGTESSYDQHSISESVAFENLVTTELYAGNIIKGVSHLEGGKSSSSSSSLSSASSSSTWMMVSKNDVKYATEKNNIEEDKDVKTTTLKEFAEVSEGMTVDLLNTSKQDSAQESNWKNSRKMHFNQEVTKVILDNQITDNTEIGQRRSDILINDTLEDYGEDQNQIPSLNYLDSLKGNSSHLNPGSLIKIAPESIIPIIPQVINDLRDDRFSEENLKVLSHAFGKYWPYIQALSKNSNLDILPLIKMKDEKDLESILTSFVLEEPNTTTVKQQDVENILDHGPAYDYLEDYKEMFQELLNQEFGKESRKKIRIKRDEEDDLKTVEATHEYFESIAEEHNEEDIDYIYEDVMYDDIPDDESDSSIFELMEIADLQVYVRNVTS